MSTPASDMGQVLAALAGLRPWWPLVEPSPRWIRVRLGDRVIEDVAWSYPTPIPENPRIAGLVCFRNERVDLVVDGERLERPVTPWS